MYILTEQQKKYLIMLLDIQDKSIWNNGRKAVITNIIKSGIYTHGERLDLNEMNKEFKKFLENRHSNPTYTEWP